MTEHLLSYSEINETVTCLAQTVTTKIILKMERGRKEMAGTVSWLLLQ
jgi:hypothetical protein